jgi:hypothetical protein
LVLLTPACAEALASRRGRPGAPLTVVTPP